MIFRRYSVCVVVLSALLLSGCISYGRVVSHDAIEFNKAYERYSNEQILLNAVRGSYQRPMKFTAFSDINGSLSVSVGADFGIPFGSSTTRGSNVDPSLSVEKSPSFTLGIQNRDQEFVRGILSPIDGETVAYFVDQGWKTPHLVQLVGERIEVEISACHGPIKEDTHRKSKESKDYFTCPPKPPKTIKKIRQTLSFKNNPDTGALEGLGSDKNCLDKIAKNNGWAISNDELIRELCGFLLIARSIGSDIAFPASQNFVGPSLSFQTAPSKIADASAILEQITNAHSAELKIGCLDANDKIDKPENCRDITKGIQLFLSNSNLVLKNQGAVFKRLGLAAVCGIEIDSDASKVCSAKLVPRSPQGVIFYLGEIARMQRELERTICFVERSGSNQELFAQVSAKEKCKGSQQISTASQGKEERKHLFLVRTATLPVVHPVASTRYLGGWHYVPSSNVEPSESGVVLGLVDYLMGLHQKAENLPVTRRVNIVGN